MDEVSEELSGANMKCNLAKRNEVFVSSLSKILTLFSRYIITLVWRLLPLEINSCTMFFLLAEQELSLVMPTIISKMQIMQ